MIQQKQRQFNLKSKLSNVISEASTVPDLGSSI